MRTDRLRQLAAFLLTLRDEQFDFAAVRYEKPECGTVGCAMGWTPTVFPDLVRFCNVGGFLGSLVSTTTLDEETTGLTCFGFRRVAVALFGMPYSHANDLFQPEHPSPFDCEELSATASKAEVAARILAYADWADENAI